MSLSNANRDRLHSNLAKFNQVPIHLFLIQSFRGRINPCLDYLITQDHRPPN